MVGAWKEKFGVWCLVRRKVWIRELESKLSGSGLGEDGRLKYGAWWEKNWQTQIFSDEWSSQYWPRRTFFYQAWSHALLEPAWECPQCTLFKQVRRLNIPNTVATSDGYRMMSDRIAGNSVETRECHGSEHMQWDKNRKSWSLGYVPSLGNVYQDIFDRRAVFESPQPLNPLPGISTVRLEAA